MITKFLTAFIPLFFAFDAVGIMPVFMSMTHDTFVDKKRTIVNQAVITAFCLSFLFIYLGKGIFHFLGISIPDFRIAGGIILLVISTYDLIVARENRAQKSSPVGDHETTIGIVPIGMPLIVGPAVLTTLLLSTGQNGYTATMLALIANVFIVWLVFHYSDHVIKIIRRAGAIAIGKVFSLLLAAIAVRMIRLGFMELISNVAK